MTSKATEKEVLNFYPLNNQFIGYCESEKNEIETKAFYQTIILMDRSTSMGAQALRLVQKIFPIFFEKLSYEPSNVIHLITFDTISELHAVTVDKFPGLPISARGNTVMTKAVEISNKVFSTFDSKKPVRVLTISDGAVHDQASTAQAAVALDNYLRVLDPRFLINSNAVRLFTSASQPDTTAVSSLLQINNGPSNSLCDISATLSDDVIAQKIADLFLTDNFNRLRTITVAKPVFKEFPWDDYITSALKLSPGENVFWVTELPKDGFTESDNTATKTVTKRTLNADGFEVLIRSTFEKIVEKIKVLQILDTTESKATIENITQYFQNTLKLIATGQRIISDMAVFNEIERLANCQTVKNMSPQEKADYLRNKIVLPPLQEVKPADSFQFLKDFIATLHNLFIDHVPAEHRLTVSAVLLALLTFIFIALFW